MYVWLMFEQLNFKKREGKREKLGWPQEREKRENKASFRKLSESHNRNSQVPHESATPLSLL